MELNQKPLAMAYVPWQKWQNIYEPAKALTVGTIFQELDQPFTGKAPAGFAELTRAQKGDCLDGDD